MEFRPLYYIITNFPDFVNRFAKNLHWMFCDYENGASDIIKNILDE